MRIKLLHRARVRVVRHRVEGLVDAPGLNRRRVEYHRIAQESSPFRLDPVVDCFTVKNVVGRCEKPIRQKPHEPLQAESSYKKAKATLANSRECSQLNPSTEVVSLGVWTPGLLFPRSFFPSMASNSMVAG